MLIDLWKMPTSTIRQCAVARAPGEDAVQGNVCHGIAKTTFVLHPQFDTSTGFASLELSAAQLEKAFGVAHTDMINLNTIRVGDCQTNINSPVGVTFHHGDNPVATNSRTCYVGGTPVSTSAGLGGDADENGVVHPMKAYHAIIHTGCGETVCHIDQPEPSVLKQQVENAIARSAKWHGAHTSSSFAESCMQVGEGLKSRWLIPVASNTEQPRCALSKAFNANMSSPAFCGGRYENKSKVAQVVNTKGQNCYVVPNSDFTSTAQSLNSLLNPLDKNMAKGLRMDFEVADPQAVTDSLYEQPQFVCSATFERTPVTTIMNDQHDIASEHVPYTTAHISALKSGSKSAAVPITTEAQMIQNVMALKLPEGSSASALPMDINTKVSSGATSADLQTAIATTSVVQPNVQPAVATAGAFEVDEITAALNEVNNEE